MYNDFNEVTREYLDYSDRDTVRLVCEAEQNQTQILSAITSMLYDKIVEKAAKIDYSTIDRSRGDITKVEKFNDLLECIDIIKALVTQYNQDLFPINTLSEAIDNVKSRTDIFQKAYLYNSPLLVMTYKNITLAICNSVSFLINTCIEYIKNPESKSFQMALDTVAYAKTMDNVLFSNLALWNDGCRKGDFDEAVKVLLNQTKIKHEATEVVIEPDAPFLKDGEEQKTVIHDDEKDKKKDVFTESVPYGMIARAFIFICKQLIYILRSIVYYFYFGKQKISDYWETQADFLEMNAMKLQYSDIQTVDDKDKVIDRQLKKAAKYRARANKWSVDHKIAQRNAAKAESEDVKKFKASDLDYDNPFINAPMF